MNLKKNFLIIIFSFIIYPGFASERVIDSVDNENFKINLKLYLNLQDLNDVEIKNNFFNSEFRYEVLSKNNMFLEYLMDDLKVDGLSDFVDLKYYTNLKSKVGVPVHSNDSLSYSSVHSLYAEFDHNWNVRNYPFDNPQLKIKFTSILDSSFLSLNPKDGKFASYLENIENLKDGFSVNSIDFKKNYISSENDPIDDSLNARNIVKEQIVFLINLNREGSWLYLKLFLGSFMAFLISWLVFFIPLKDFESRVELSIGAIFGAVGNRAYVESIMPDVQVFTKADMINNAIIFLIIFNIIVIMIQKNKYINLDFFESNWNSAIYTAFMFVVINAALLLW